MSEFAKGIGIGMVALAVAYAAVQLKNPYICWAFLVCAAIAHNWKTTKDDDKE